MADEAAGIEINGQRYEVPRLDSFDMDEAQILHDVAGVIIEDFVPPHPDAPAEVQKAAEQLELMRVRDPRFRRALVHVALRRNLEDYTFEKYDPLVGKLNAVDVSVAVLSRGDDEDPSQSSPKPLESRNSESETSEPSSSTKPSGSDSVAPGKILGPIGVSRSGMSSESSPTPATSAS